MTERDIFLAALELPASARAAYLDRTCGDNAGLRAKVESLLQSHQSAGSFLSSPVFGTTDPDYAATQDFSKDSAQPHDEETESEEPDDETADATAFLSPSARPGSLGRIGHYEVLQVLGRGAFGIVYRALDDLLQRVVAVKVLAPQMAATSPARKRFLREARTSAQVRHENVVQVYEVGEQPLPYLVMEFIPGETLQQRLDRMGPVEPLETVRIAKQIAEGLAAAHATDLIHRDIKPGNILLEGGTFRVKLTDFGLARAADDASISQSGIIAGTPMYMAPEQAKGETLDQRADLFSLGSVMYQMVAGRPPFRANTTLAVLKRVAEDNPRPIREIIPETPLWLCDIITKLHAKNPADRFQSAREVADVLAQCEEQLKLANNTRKFPLIAKPPVPSEPRNTPSRWKWAAAGLLLTTVLLAGMFWSPLELFLTNRGEVELDNVEAGYEVTVRQNGTDLVTRSTRRKFRVAAGVPVELRFFATGRENEVFRTDAEVHRGGKARVNFAAELAALEEANRARIPNNLAKLGKAMNDFTDSSFGKLPQVPANYTGVPPKAIRGNDTCIAYQYSPDGKWLVTRDYAHPNTGAMRVREVATGEVRATIPNSLNRGGAFSPDGKLFAHPERDGGRMHIVVRNVGMFDVVKRMDCEANNVEGIAFDRNSKVVAACADKKVILWTADTGAEVLRLAGKFHQPFGLSFSPTGDRLLLQESRGGFQRDGCWDQDSHVHLYDIDLKSQTSKLLRTWEAPNDGYAFDVHFSPDGARALFCRGEQGLTRVAIHDVKTGAKVRDIVPQRTYTQITLGAVSPDGKRVVLRHGQDGVHVGVWNLDTGERVSGFDLTGTAHRAFAVDPTFRTACVGFHTSSDAKFYDLATGKELVPGGAQPAPQPPFTDADAKRIAALPANDQIEAVVAELKKRNPKFDGALAPTTEGNVIVKLEFWTDSVTDISPLRALTGLKALAARGTDGKGQLANLAPLQGLPLEMLDVNNNSPLANLAPLKGLPLKQLFVQNTAVRDLTPLAGLKLTELNLSAAPVADLSPLKEMPLVTLYLDSTNVANLTPLRGMPLKQLNIRELKLTPARDHPVLRTLFALESINSESVADFWKAIDPTGVPPFTDADAKRIAALPANDQIEAVRDELKKRNPKFDGKFEATIDGVAVTRVQLCVENVKDVSPLRAFHKLAELNLHGGPEPLHVALTDISPLKGMPLTVLYLFRTKVTDLTPLKGMPLRRLELASEIVPDLTPVGELPSLEHLSLGGSPLRDIKPIAGLKLKQFHCNNTGITDVTPLKGMPLTDVTLHQTRVTDITPLKGAPLNLLNLESTNVADLSPLKGTPITKLRIVDTKVTDLSILKELPLKSLSLDYKPERDAEILRAIKTLETINDKPAKEFLK